MSAGTLFLKHKDGATHAFGGRKLAKLLSELKAGRGMPEIVNLMNAGYRETLGGTDLSGEDLYEPLLAESSGRMSAI